MASPNKKLPTNVEGDFFVDSSCIDCAACRWIAPKTFSYADDASRVYAQPSTPEERHRALMAVVACPTASIGTIEKHEMAPVLAAFPDPIDGEVHHLGYHDEASFGATAYLIVRKSGNVMVDVPRFAKPLVRRLESLGGVKTLFLTHRDDVGDHEKYRAHFALERIMHADDVGHDTRGIERKLEGVEPIALERELLVIPTPGHTRGSACLLYRDKYLFTGDHLAFSPTRGHVYAFRDACWYNWALQKRSVERLRAHRFEWILPGHGLRCTFPSAEMQQQIERCIAWM